MAEERTHGSNFDKSDESSRPEIVLGKAEGSAYGTALAYLSKMEANDSGEQTAGDYIVAYAIEDAEGLYEMRDGKLQWTEKQDENCHIEIAVRSAADGRFLPCLKVTATLADSNGKEIATQPMPFLWHPWIYHYGRNWSVPGDGEYRLRVHVDAPDFPRHDRINGRRFQEPVNLEFKLRIKTGRKVSKAA
jgi:Fe2+ transport protein